MIVNVCLPSLLSPWSQIICVKKTTISFWKLGLGFAFRPPWLRGETSDMPAHYTRLTDKTLNNLTSDCKLIRYWSELQRRNVRWSRRLLANSFTFFFFTTFFLEVSRALVRSFRYSNGNPADIPYYPPFDTLWIHRFGMPGGNIAHPRAPGRSSGPRGRRCLNPVVPPIHTQPAPASHYRPCQARATAVEYQIQKTSQEVWTGNE